MKDAENQAQEVGIGGESDSSSPESRYIVGKKHYVAPVLRRQAHLRDITLGGTQGAGETDLGEPRAIKVPDSSPQDDRQESFDAGSGVFEESIWD